MHIYYINLHNSVDRNNIMKQQLQNYNHKRIEAYNGNNYMNYIKVNKNPYNKPTTNACIASHLYAIKTAYDDGLEEVMIIEDDINLEILHQTFEELQIIWNCHKEEMDILQIHSASQYAVQQLYIDALKTGSLKLVDKVNNVLQCWQTTGYIIHRSGMELFLQFYDSTNDFFNLTPYNSYNVADMILYIICKTKIINLPFINIFSPIEILSTIQDKHHSKNIQYQPYQFIEQYKQQFITIIKNYCLIPRIIHIFYKDSINNKLLTNIKKYYSKWELKIWHNTSVESFIDTNYKDYLDIYYSLENKEKFLSYLFVYHYGGFYIDPALEIQNRLQKYLTKLIVVFNEEWSVFGARPLHPALKEKLDGFTK